MRGNPKSCPIVLSVLTQLTNMHLNSTQHVVAQLHCQIITKCKEIHQMNFYKSTLVNLKLWNLANLTNIHLLLKYWGELWRISRNFLFSFKRLLFELIFFGITHFDDFGSQTDWSPLSSVFVKQWRQGSKKRLKYIGIEKIKNTLSSQRTYGSNH